MGIKLSGGDRFSQEPQASLGGSGWQCWAPSGRKAALPRDPGGCASRPPLEPVLLVTCLPRLSPWKIKPHREPGLSGLTLPSIYLFFYIFLLFTVYLFG